MPTRMIRLPPSCSSRDASAIRGLRLAASAEAVNTSRLELRYDRSREHEDPADREARGKGLAQKDDAAYGGEKGLHREDDGGVRRMRGFLRVYLQGEGDAGRKYPAVEYRDASRRGSRRRARSRRRGRPRGSIANRRRTGRSPARGRPCGCRSALRRVCAGSRTEPPPARGGRRAPC